MTDKSQHTPGPWAFSKYFGNKEFIEKAEILGVEPVRALDNNGGCSVTFIGGAICTVLLRREDIKQADKHCAEDPERDANARLIAAAPDLLELVEDVLEDETPGLDTEWNIAARAIVAKAKGHGE